MEPPQHQSALSFLDFSPRKRGLSLALGYKSLPSTFQGSATLCIICQEHLTHRIQGPSLSAQVGEKKRFLLPASQISAH